MSTLILPMGGLSSRFPNSKPKWMLTHPKSNTYMILETLKGINTDFFDKIIFTFLQEHEDTYSFFDCFKKELKRLGLFEKSDFCILHERTNNQPHTVYNTIVNKNLSGFIFVKDCDSYYETILTKKDNQVCYHDLNKIKDINAISKSYIEFDSNQYITNIVEKQIISSYFNVGGYGFACAQTFAGAYEALNNNSTNFYLSHVIYKMMLDNHKFFAQETNNFKDWGTLEDWNKYLKTYKTVFIDLDGTLVTNSSHLQQPTIGNSKPIIENINLIKNLYTNGRTHIIITTSRPDRYRKETVMELDKFGIPFDTLLMGLPHCQRILINDFANSNPYPSCSAVNIPRNSNELNKYLN